MRILIPELMRRNVLAAIRSLGRGGHHVTLAMPRPGNQDNPRSTYGVLERLSRSRYLADVADVTSPFEDTDAFIADVVQLVTRGSFDVVLPFSYSSCACVSLGKPQLEHLTGLAIGDFEQFMKLHNKWNAIELARSVGVPVPRTYWPLDIAEVEALSRIMDYPVVVKAHIGCGVRQGVRYANDAEELVSDYRKMVSQGSLSFIEDFSRPLIQEYIPGEIHDVATICSHGRLRGALTQLRAITYPLSGGVGAVNVTTREPRMLEMAQRLLEAAGWHGPALVEFKLDPRDNTYKLMEVNPKFWGTTDLSIKAGIDFPRMACEIARDGDTAPQFDYRVGLTYRWATGYELLCVTQDEQRLRALAGYVGRFFKRDTVYDFCPTDPLPDIAALLQAATARLSRSSRGQTELTQSSSRGNA
jgi:predicted ATP-grasp superfamily ATP-dependent carboligase